MTQGATKIKLVYGADPRIGNQTIVSDGVYVFDGGLMTNTGVMITVSLDVGLELTWDTSQSVRLSVRLFVDLYLAFLENLLFQCFDSL